MKLYYNPASNNCRRVVATIHQLGLPVELQTVDFFSPKFDEGAFNQMNPNGMVPTFDDGGFHLWESTAIMQYLCEKKGNTDLFPSEPKARADVSRWQSWDLAHFGPACGTYLWENILKPMFGAGDPDPKALEDARQDFERFGAVLDQHLAGRKFVCGDRPTLADFSIAASLMYAEPAKMPWAPFKNIRAWYGRVDATDGWKKSAPPARAN